MAVTRGQLLDRTADPHLARLPGRLVVAHVDSAAMPVLAMSTATPAMHHSGLSERAGMCGSGHHLQNRAAVGAIFDPRRLVVADDETSARVAEFSVPPGMTPAAHRTGFHQHARMSNAGNDLNGWATDIDEAGKRRFFVNSHEPGVAVSRAHHWRHHPSNVRRQFPSMHRYGTRRPTCRSPCRRHRYPLLTTDARHRRCFHSRRHSPACH